MRRIITGQLLLIICCIFYLIWWYRGYRPGVPVNRVSGINGILLFLTMAFGIAGVVFSLMQIPEITEPKIHPVVIIITGITAYIVLFLSTRFLFHRIVTAELFLIVAWTMLEVTVLNHLYAGGFLTDKSFVILIIVIAFAFVISMILYVAYYRMEEMKAFYAAMIPLVTEAAAMAVLIGVALLESSSSTISNKIM